MLFKCYWLFNPASHTLWEDADPGIAEVDDAKERLDGLKGQYIPTRFASQIYNNNPTSSGAPVAQGIKRRTSNQILE